MFDDWPAQYSIDMIQRFFGPSYTWSQMAAWIEARAKAKERLPEPMVIWARDFQERRRQQERTWKD